MREREMNAFRTRRAVSNAFSEKSRHDPIHCQCRRLSFAATGSGSGRSAGHWQCRADLVPTPILVPVPLELAVPVGSDSDSTRARVKDPMGYGHPPLKTCILLLLLIERFKGPGPIVNIGS